MKLSAWHKQQGDTVEWYNPITALCEGEYDKVYMAKVFSFTADYDNMVYAKEIIKGGTGYYYPDGGKPLPEEVEHIYPDYKIYNITNTAYGFLTRGCPRNCAFCVVGCKEGLISHKVADLTEFWRGQKNIELLDPNLLACKQHKELLQQLIDCKAWVNINQGVDARLLTLENTDLIKQIKIKLIHFAWDNYKDGKTVLNNLKMFKEMTGWDKRKIIVYVLTNYNTTHEQDLERIYRIREIGCWPYVTVYDLDKLPKGHITKRLRRWVNMRAIFESIPNFKDYTG